MSRTIDTSVWIDAPVARVAAVLADVARYPTWNPRLRFASPLVEGARVPMRVRLFGLWLTVPVRLERVAPGDEIRWVGGLPGLFTGTHHLRLVPDRGGCRVDHGEAFGGVAVAVLLPGLRGELERLYREVNAGLVAACGDGGAGAARPG